MATRLVHVVDEDSGEDARGLLALLLARLSSMEVEQRVIAIGSQSPAQQLPEGLLQTRVRRDVGWGIPSRDLRRALTAEYSAVIHAWGGRAAAAVRAACPMGLRIVVTITDPSEADRLRTWWPLGQRVQNPCVVCTCERARQRLVSSGLPRESSVVIRPGIDIDQSRRPQRRITRSDLGLAAEAKVFTTASPPSRRGGQYHAIWATAIVHQIRPEIRLVIPGVSREASRLGRLIDNIYCPEAYLQVGDHCSPTELLAISDALLFPPLDDVPTGWLALAMAAGVPVIGTAIPSVTELITDGQTGFLGEPGQPHRLAISIHEAMTAGNEARHRAAAARRLAEQWFDPARCAAQYLQALVRAGTADLHVAEQASSLAS